MKIKGVANRYGVNESTLRYYEKEGLIGPINRINGIRTFSEEDIERLELIIFLRSSDVTIEDLKIIFKKETKKDEKEQILSKIKSDLIKKVEIINQTIKKIDLL